MKTIKMLAASAVLLAAACGGGSSNKADAAVHPIDAPITIDSPPPMIDAGPPAAPGIGAQIDRMGRPAINTALNHTFDSNMATKDAAKDAYNANATPSTWNTAVPEFMANLAILDGLDTVCGNQLGADLTPTRYQGLAGALADDELYVNAASGSCGAYLGVEANALGVVPNNDCGGRTPLEDIIDESYSVLAAGALSGVSDGVASDMTGTASLTTFPFLAAPN